MGKQSVLREKSFLFSLEIIELCRFLKETNQQYILYRQLLRSGTAIGALVREAEFAQSKADFINKLSIALKEANETEYWMKLLSESRCFSVEATGKAANLLTEMIKMLISSINTAKSNRIQ